MVVWIQVHLVPLEKGVDGDDDDDFGDADDDVWQVYLVLWYRELAGKPLYSFDLRGRPQV